MDQATRNQIMQKRLKDSQMRAQGLGAVNGARDLHSNLRASLPSTMMPGNVGDINKVIWPFWFTFQALELAPGTSSQVSFTVTQEAAFVVLNMSKVVFNKTTGPLAYTAYDPLQADNSLGEVGNLFFSLRDTSSSRTFQSTPQPIDTIGGNDEPTVLPTPILFLPNAGIEMLYSNQDPSLTLVPFVTLFGYRVRIEDAQNLLSTVTG